MSSCIGGGLGPEAVAAIVVGAVLAVLTFVTVVRRRKTERL